MTEDERDDKPARRRPARDKSSVTPDDEPSALERGARIFERLARKPDSDRR